MKCKLRHQLLRGESLGLRIPRQNFISQDEIAGILAEFGFEDTAHKCDVPTLLNDLVGT